MSVDLTCALQITTVVLLAGLGSVLNILVYVVFHRRPTLRSPSSRFILCLVIANLITTLVVVPVLLVQLLQEDSSVLWWLHQISSGLTTFAVTSSIFSVLAIAIDRYNAVLSPLHYSMTITRQRSRGMIALVWGSSSILAIPHFIGSLVPYPLHFSQSLSLDFRAAANTTVSDNTEVFTLTYAMVLITIAFTLPLFALCWIYAKMYNAAHRNSERTRRHSVCTSQGEMISVSVPNSRGGSLELPGAPPNSGTPEHFRRNWRNPPLSHLTTKRRSSNASFSALLFREEGRAVKTATMVIASYLLCWTPYFVTVFLDTWGSIGNSKRVSSPIVPEYLRFLALLATLASDSVTPFIYVFRNDATRKETLKMLIWWRERGDKYNSNIRCSKDMEALKGAPKPNGFGPPILDNFALRRQSLTHSDTVSVQSFPVPPPLPECHHFDDTQRGFGSADFVATYDIVESASQGDVKNRPLENISEDANPEPTSNPAPKLRRESVTFRLAFLPQKRCQTCIRQNSDSSSGSGQMLVREANEPVEKSSPPCPAPSNGSILSSFTRLPASQRRKRFVLTQQGSSGDELTASSSEPGTPRLIPDRRHEYAADGLPSSDEHMVLCAVAGDDSLTSDVILEMDEPCSGEVQPVVADHHSHYFQFQNVRVPLSASQEQCSSHTSDLEEISSRSDSTTRQDSNLSDVTIDSGVVSDIGMFNRSQSSSSSISSNSAVVQQRPKRQRHKLQRLAAVEDEDISQAETEGVNENPIESVKNKLKSSFKSRFHRSPSRTTTVEC